MDLATQSHQFSQSATTTMQPIKTQQIKIQPIKAFNDNYIWAIVHLPTKQAIVIDPGQAEPVIEYLNQYELTLTAIWITHKHRDHIGGVARLQETFAEVQVIAHNEHHVEQTQTVEEGSSVSAFGHIAQVWHIAGHTENHLAYLLEIDNRHHVFCGDTLFSGGCGRVFTGDMHAMHTSLQRLATLADKTLLYPAHEYTASNLKFGLYAEPDNLAMKQRLLEVEKLRSANQASLPTTLASEKQINIFLRVSEDTVISSLAEKTELSSHEPAQVFAQLRTMKDGF